MSKRWAKHDEIKNLRVWRLTVLRQWGGHSFWLCLLACQCLTPVSGVVQWQSPEEEKYIIGQHVRQKLMTLDASELQDLTCIKSESLHTVAKSVGYFQSDTGFSPVFQFQWYVIWTLQSKTMKFCYALTWASSPGSPTVSTSRERMSESVAGVRGCLRALKIWKERPA